MIFSSMNKGQNKLKLKAKKDVVTQGEKMTSWVLLSQSFS